MNISDEFRAFVKVLLGPRFSCLSNLECGTSANNAGRHARGSPGAISLLDWAFSK